MLKVLTVLLILMLCACTKNATNLMPYPGETAQQILGAGKAALRRGNLPEAVKRYNAVLLQYPLNNQRDLALIYLMYAYYKQEEFAAAENTATRFIQIYPDGQYADYAYFIRGLAQYYRNQSILDRVANVDLARRDLTDFKAAFSDFAVIVNRFPHSPYAAASYQYLIYLRDLFARHQLQIAQFYYQRLAYQAAINRANIIVQSYHDSAVLVAAQELLVQCYLKLGLTAQANLIAGSMLAKKPKNMQN